MQDLIVLGEHGWVLQGVLSRASFRRSAVSGQKVFAVSSLHISNFFLPGKKGIAKKIIQAISMAPLGVVAAVTISVLSMKYFLTVPCRRCRAPHRCGDLDPSRTIGWTSVVFSSKPALNVFGK